MPNEGNSEFYFIAAMMLLTVILCCIAVYAFIKTYKKEMRERAERSSAEQKDAPEDTRQE